MSEQSGFAGSWRVTVTNQVPPQLALGTFGSEGTLVTSPLPVFPPMRASGEAIHTSAGHGSWEPTGPNDAILTFVVLAADQQGNPLLTMTARAHLTLGDDGQSWNAEGVRNFADLAGNTIATEPIVVHGTRIVAEAPELSMTPTPAAAVRAG